MSIARILLVQCACLDENWEWGVQTLFAEGRWLLGRSSRKMNISTGKSEISIEL